MSEITMKHYKRIPNFIETRNKNTCTEFSIFLEFLKNIKEHSPEVMISLDPYTDHVPPYIFRECEKGEVVIRYYDVLNPFINGWVVGAKNQVERFLLDYKKSMKKSLKEGQKIYFNEKVFIIDYISKIQPNPLIAVSEDRKEAISVNDSDDFLISI